MGTFVLPGKAYTLRQTIRANQEENLRSPSISTNLSYILRWALTKVGETLFKLLLSNRYNVGFTAEVPKLYLKYNHQD